MPLSIGAINADSRYHHLGAIYSDVPQTRDDCKELL